MNITRGVSVLLILSLCLIASCSEDSPETKTFVRVDNEDNVSYGGVYVSPIPGFGPVSTGLWGANRLEGKPLNPGEFISFAVGCGNFLYKVLVTDINAQPLFVLQTYQPLCGQTNKLIIN